MKPKYTKLCLPYRRVCGVPFFNENHTVRAVRLRLNSATTDYQTYELKIIIETKFLKIGAAAGIWTRVVSVAG